MWQLKLYMFYLKDDDSALHNYKLQYTSTINV